MKLKKKLKNFKFSVGLIELLKDTSFITGRTETSLVEEGVEILCKKKLREKRRDNE